MEAVDSQGAPLHKDCSNQGRSQRSARPMCGPPRGSAVLFSPGSVIWGGLSQLFGPLSHWAGTPVFVVGVGVDQTPDQRSHTEDLKVECDPQVAFLWPIHCGPQNDV